MLLIIPILYSKISDIIAPYTHDATTKKTREYIKYVLKPKNSPLVAIA